MLKKTITAGSLAACTVLLVAACGGGTTPQASAPGDGDFAVDGTMTLPMVSDPGSLSPHMTASSDARRVSNFIYDRMTLQDPTTGEFKPWLAKSWTEKPNEVTFTLKEGITCSDGTPFTAQTAADNFNFVANKDNNSPLRGVWVPGDVKATADDATGMVTLTTPEASPFLLANVSALNIVCESGLKDPSSLDKASAGTGLFTLKDVAANDHYTLERRAGYSWGPDESMTSDTPGVPKEIIFKIVPDESTSANLLLSGGLNIAAINGPDEARVKAAKLPSTSSVGNLGQMYYNQMEGKPTADPAVRIALTQGLDLDNVTKVMSNSKGQRTAQLSTSAPVACQMTTTEALPAFDATAAAKALDNAGWKTGADGRRSKGGQELKLNLVYEILNDTTTAAAEYAAQEWAKIGVTIELLGGDSNMVGSKLLSGSENASWDIAWEPFNISTPSMIVPFFSGPTPTAGTNFADIHNADYETGAKHASSLVGEDACKAWGEAEKALFASADVVPFASTTSNTYFNKAVLALEKSLIGPSVRLLK